MSRPLQYPAKCEKCGVLMNPGTEADWFPDGNAYRYLHAGDCEVENAKAAKPVKLRPRIDTRECSRYECHYATGVGFRGRAPSKCPLCESPWLIDESDESWQAVA